MKVWTESRLYQRAWLAPLLGALALLASESVEARGQYPSQIPNTNQCSRCHLAAGGGGERNDFGNDVANNKAAALLINWPAVCLLDSDDDGETNGQELGDPCCIWTAGATPASATVSDPADENAQSGNVCAPVDAGPPIDAGAPVDGGEPDPQPDPGPGVGPPPAAWACPAAEYNDGTVCHCGCESGDPDCDSPTQATCDADGCRPGFIVDTTDTRYCVPGGDPVDAGPGNAPADWVCDESWFGSADGCDCGCGVIDDDCDSAAIEACSTNSCPNANQGFIPDSADATQCIPEEDGDGGTCSHTKSGSGGGGLALALLGLVAIVFRPTSRRRTTRARATASE